MEVTPEFREEIGDIETMQDAMREKYGDAYKTMLAIYICEKKMKQLKGKKGGKAKEAKEEEDSDSSSSTCVVRPKACRVRPAKVKMETIRPMDPPEPTPAIDILSPPKKGRGRARS